MNESMLERFLRDHLQPDTTSPDDNQKSQTKKKSKKKQPRLRMSYEKWQLEILENKFEETHYPNKTQWKLLSDQLQIPENHVIVWFQNRRAKHRKLNPDWEMDLQPETLGSYLSRYHPNVLEFQQRFHAPEPSQDHSTSNETLPTPAPLAPPPTPRIDFDALFEEPTNTDTFPSLDTSDAFALLKELFHANGINID